jgi:hypothetical protein
VYKLGKNWQTRAWNPVFKTAGSAPDAAMILGLFCLFCFLGFARRNFYPALFTLLYFIILVVAISF